jgi:hypothetical protein
VAGVAAIVVGTGVAAAPTALATAPHAATPNSVTLSSSDGALKSSTKQSIKVALEASNNPSTPANDTVNVVLSKGVEDASETHIWSFPISSSALHVASNGSGTLKVPAAKISPFGSISLTFKPIAKATSQSCNSTVVSKTVKVSLSGVFFFDSKSTGAHKWGTVGSKQHFSFPATNTVTWQFSSPSSENCIPASAPCAASLTWAAQANGVAFDGVSTNQTSSVVRASRSTSLAKPQGASRIDSNVATTTVPTINPNAQGNDVLTVTGSGSTITGSATITSSQPAATIPTPCGSNGGTESSQFFTGAYANGSTPLTVAEQIYGALSLADNSNGTVEQTQTS